MHNLSLTAAAAAAFASPSVAHHLSLYSDFDCTKESDADIWICKQYKYNNDRNRVWNCGGRSVGRGRTSSCCLSVLVRSRFLGGMPHQAPPTQRWNTGVAPKWSDICRHECLSAMVAFFRWCSTMSDTCSDRIRGDRCDGATWSHWRMEPR